MDCCSVEWDSVKSSRTERGRQLWIVAGLKRLGEVQEYALDRVE